MLSPGTLLQGRYRVVRQLAKGGMGTVYEAIDQRLHTTVALKETSYFDNEALRRQFEREAQLLARLHHPALPRVSDHFTEAGGQFLVMQFISGPDLEEMRRAQPGGMFPPEQVLRWADQLLDALDYLHTQQSPVIHRDIKPQNLKLTPRGQIVLLDFGLAKGSAGPTPHATSGQSLNAFTREYAPLEQLHGTGTDARSDLFSLAVTLYHLATGLMPPDALTRLAATQNGQPDPLRPAHEINSRVPTAASAVIVKAMSVTRGQRPASAVEMREELREAARQEEELRNAITIPAQPPAKQVESAQAEQEVVSTPDVPTRPHKSPTADAAQARPSPLVSSTPARRLPSLRVGGVAVLVSAGLVCGLLALYTFWPIGTGSLSAAPPEASPGTLTSARDTPTRPLKSHKHVRVVAFARDGKTFASGGGDAVKVWDGVTFELKRTIDYDRFIITGLAFSPDGGTLAVALNKSRSLLGSSTAPVSGGPVVAMIQGNPLRGSAIGGIFFVDPQTGKVDETRPKLQGLDDNSVGDVAFSADGRYLYGTVGSHGMIWDLRTGKYEMVFEGGPYPHFAVSRDGRVFAMASYEENDVKLYDTQAGALQHTLTGHTDARPSEVFSTRDKGVRELAFSPTEEVLASCGADGTTRLWDAATGESLRILKEEEDRAVYAVAFSPDGLTVATGSFRSVRLWDVRTGTLKGTFSAEDRGFGDPLAFSPDGRKLVCGSDDGLLIFDLGG